MLPKVAALLPAAEFAVAYGSSVFRQQGYTGACVVEVWLRVTTPCRAVPCSVSAHGCCVQRRAAPWSTLSWA
jgi:hypothetical protein